jgi:hypothetical protein
MTISSDVLVHFTHNKQALKGILEDNFRVSYCKETPEISTNRTCVYVPMVSFCDIPLSQVKYHIEIYGCYGLGLTRDWGLKNGLNPLTYVESSSNFSQSLANAVNYFLPKARQENLKLAQDDEYFKAVLGLGELIGNIKSYSGDYERGGKTHKDYRFYDEREWRFVPRSSEENLLMISEETWHTPIGQEKARRLTESYRLKFDPDDIKYVIIKDDSEIHEFIDHFRSVKSGKYGEKDIDRLTTRILTYEQIKKDF